MATFSWADTARAIFGSCLPCLQTRVVGDEEDRQQLGRRDELEGLLQNAEFSDAEVDAEVLSLHSQIGRSDGRKRVKKKRGKGKGSIKLFGYDLFGRPLQENSNQEQEASLRVSRISSSTLDSDAAPLGDDAIAESVQADLERREAEAARKARKELRKQKKVAALLDTQSESFEGFPGSGPTLEDYGAFQQAPVSNHDFVELEGGGADEAVVAADFDADSYLQSASHRSDSGSGTRSRTSTSMSNSQEQPPPYRMPLPPSSTSSNPKPKRSKKSGKRSATTGSTGTSSQPRSPTVTAHPPDVNIASPGETWKGHPQNDGTFEGVPFDSNFNMPGPAKLVGQLVHGDSAEGVFPSPGLSSSRGFPSSGFSRSTALPSPGLGGRKNSLSASGKGVFLARTGDDE
ncbi:hypothetical protein BU17DRAFT_88422 [Hysterangium stoloniferum]|nr:hypothetical protein BU17DRAFT_88422 [Hysterangium stoloniferum]